MTSSTRAASLVVVALLALAGAAAAQGAGAAPWKPDTGDTAWMLTSSALVLFMTPGLALFYGGLVRKKNIVNMLMMCFAILCLVSVTWVLWGYSLAFAPGSPFIGGMQWAGLNGVGINDANPLAPTIPHQAFMAFQMMFAIITPALIVGAFADRMRFAPFLVFMLLWSTFVYSPVAHWVWGGGWLGSMGALDFAGGTVVHINAGVAALAAVLVIGKRKGYGSEPMVPHNLPMVMLGTAMLWFGWFGFNAGSAVASGGLATSAFVVTNTATGTAAITWMLASWARRGKPGIVDTCSGAVAGLVAITPASGFVDVTGAIAIGIGAGLICYAVAIWRSKKGLDDALDVFAVHGVGGTWGAIATGLFANPAINSLGTGLLYGNPGQMGPQLTATLATWAYTFALTFAMLFVINKVWPIRVKPEEEQVGLDIAVHGEEGYLQ
ncbi:MAG: ammonium transporter [Halobacteria archaeon]